jgi:hypothetical protein
VDNQGNTEITFFQRDGKRSISQKLKDFKNGVRYGTELAAKHSKELRLPADIFTNIKNAKSKPSISNEKLNQLFRETKEKLASHKPFKKKDTLVSHTNKSQRQEINIDINNKRILDREDAKFIFLNYFFNSLVKTETHYDDNKHHLQLAIDVHDNPGTSFDINMMRNAKDALTQIRLTNLRRDGYDTDEQHEKKVNEFIAKVDRLIGALEVAIAKAPPQENL